VASGAKLAIDERNIEFQIMGDDQFGLVKKFNGGFDIFGERFLVAEVPVRITMSRLRARVVPAAWIANEMNVFQVEFIIRKSRCFQKYCCKADDPIFFGQTCRFDIDKSYALWNFRQPSGNWLHCCLYVWCFLFLRDRLYLWRDGR